MPMDVANSQTAGAPGGLQDFILAPVSPSSRVSNPDNRLRNVVVLGATGSVGRAAVEVIQAAGDQLRAWALCARRSTALLEQQAHVLLPRWVVVTDEEAARQHDFSGLPAGVELLVGPQAVSRIVAEPEVDVVLSAVAGSSGLAGTWAALQAGKTVALANKESLVVGGSLIMNLARQHHACVLPVDSEHSAIFQALQAGQRSEIQRVILTASGGPFRTRSKAQLANVTVADALAHPTWNMGQKISIDSATLMNKALEIIEARWLFNLKADQLAVTIHPQSIVHSMVEYVDGSIIAQLSPPDMKLPIHYALTWPNRCAGPAARLDWQQAWNLDFEPPDLERFEALALGFEVARNGGTAGAVLNAANEAAVSAFLKETLAFADIVPLCRSVLNHHNFHSKPTLEQLQEVDRWARAEVARAVNS
jgi:1-deoxy-D-xylulose-5-phosphate reductoisomerase